MSTDLENDLRDALHARAATITPDRLRRPPAPHRSVRRPVGAWVAAAALVLVAIVAVGFAVLGGKDSGDHVAATGDAPDLRGTAWSVVAVTVGGRRQPITSAEVSVAFHLDHRFDARDGVNYYSGHWQQDGDHVTITDVVATAAGYAGDDPAVLAAQRGIGALDGTLAVSVRDGALRLTARDVTVELSTRTDIDPGFSGEPSGASAPVSSTGTPTGGAPKSYVNGSELAPSAS